ncbi:hypothetical protein FN846DRAFT_655407 [Sphaerosporella brunnea]|uniref:Uncharacterized protein n=1 Tax=Sphaerosporella brunnea TaxID=1250544 RepID=A0A5J5F0R3_9PEZI|nr:hypothetical protein FN846DRAFT_655407 [Sphaerosporella brunnea]
MSYLRQLEMHRLPKRPPRTPVHSCPLLVFVPTSTTHYPTAPLPPYPAERVLPPHLPQGHITVLHSLHFCPSSESPAPAFSLLLLSSSSSSSSSSASSSAPSSRPSRCLLVFAQLCRCRCRCRLLSFPFFAGLPLLSFDQTKQHPTASHPTHPPTGLVIRITAHVPPRSLAVSNKPLTGAESIRSNNRWVIINLSSIPRRSQIACLCDLYLLKSLAHPPPPPPLVFQRQRQRFETSKEQQVAHPPTPQKDLSQPQPFQASIGLHRFDIFAKLLALAHRSSKAPLRSAGTAGEARTIAFGSTILLDSSSNSG